jgi:hypothetical protein
MISESARRVLAARREFKFISVSPYAAFYLIEQPMDEVCSAGP